MIGDWRVLTKRYDMCGGGGGNFLHGGGLNIIYD